MDAAERGDGIIINAELSLEHTLACGQAFRWTREGAGFRGVACGRSVRAEQLAPDRVLLSPCTLEDFERLWRAYFDLDRDYAQYARLWREDPLLSAALSYAKGMRILRQTPFETVISFIISANNHIPRIRSIIGRLCARYGAPLGEEQFDFPNPAALSRATGEEMRALGAGYRAEYILQTARSIDEGFPLDAIGDMPIERARKTLCALPGVGPKVAECILLFAFGRQEAFPVDTWVKKIMCEHYLDADRPRMSDIRLCARRFALNAGYAQQVLFHYFRNGKAEGV